MRLNKRIAHLGLASRREADRLIADGRVRVNGEIVTEMGHKVDPETDQVSVDKAGLEAPLYLAVNKPAGYTCDAKPSAQEPKVVTQLVDFEGVYPIGRLDKDSTGLIFLTNDGTLATALNHPEEFKEKEYEVVVDHPIAEGALVTLQKGMPLMGGHTRPTKTRRLSENRFRITLTEGKNRQIRRMCRKVGANVRHLKRVRIDCVELGDIKIGHWRHLTEDEVAQLKTPINPEG
jgi:23S rRNA pseudouridine2605 synthase/23S rRNA pseudouridine2604 synthase